MFEISSFDILCVVVKRANLLAMFLHRCTQAFEIELLILYIILYQHSCQKYERSNERGREAICWQSARSHQVITTTFSHPPVLMLMICTLILVSTKRRRR